MSTIFLGLGSNIDPEANLKAAAKELRDIWPDIRFSHVYRSKAAEVTDQPDFLNAVAVIETDETPEKISSRLHTIEKILKKNPPFRFGPRTIDLDLLLYGDDTITTAKLTVPHPRMHQRRFVLEPLLELTGPETRHPVLRHSLAELLRNLKDPTIERITLVL